MSGANRHPVRRPIGTFLGRLGLLLPAKFWYCSHQRRAKARSLVSELANQDSTARQTTTWLRTPSHADLSTQADGHMNTVSETKMNHVQVCGQLFAVERFLSSCLDLSFSTAQPLFISPEIVQMQPRHSKERAMEPPRARVRNARSREARNRVAVTLAARLNTGNKGRRPGDLSYVFHQAFSFSVLSLNTLPTLLSSHNYSQRRHWVIPDVWETSDGFPIGFRSNVADPSD
ncbi:hypothetical protein N657DRAFT_358046 [Parathielavia appendiculata]|uniref:Uncharacterized protein n=1 Tax=Parathielavia appendiculata TaxID=2587402 RepID=A0AAN6Z4C9_9PEZI|nr:hypothetical protein N657DRAFT_358046 [Parathielavia appendiculata]